MRLRTTIVTIVLFLAGFATAAPAQQFDPNDPDIQEMMAIGQTMFQRMNDAGIDMQAIGQQFQDGTFDPDAFQQMLVDKGVIDDALMSRMQKAGTKLSLTFIKQALNSTDEEWTILLPKLEKVVNTTLQLGPIGMGLGAQGGGRGGMGMMMTAAPDSPVLKALKALQAELDDKNSTKIAVRLKEYREARDKLRKELDGFQENLKSVITIRQEGILVTLGILR